MADIEQTVFIVDDESALRNSLRWLLESIRLCIETFDSAESFLASYTPDRAGCLVLDVRMPGMSGLELYELLLERRSTLPVIFITGHGDVPMAVSALKKGAVDFIEKPFGDKDMLHRIEHCLGQERENRAQRRRQDAAAQRLARLTAREAEVLALIVAGKLNKQIADTLDISIKTVEAHRARIMEKMGIRSVAELVQAVLDGKP